MITLKLNKRKFNLKNTFKLKANQKSKKFSFINKPNLKQLLIYTCQVHTYSYLGYELKKKKTKFIKIDISMFHNISPLICSIIKYVWFDLF